MSLRSRWKLVVVACATGFLVSLVGFVWLLFSPVSVNAWITSHWIIAPSRAGGIAFLSRANEPQGVVSLHGFPGMVLVVATNNPPTATTMVPDNGRRMQWMPAVSGTWFRPPATTVAEKQVTPGSVLVMPTQASNAAPAATPAPMPQRFMCFVPLWWVPALFGVLTFVVIRRFNVIRRASLCKQCGYLLASLPMPVCPECGSVA